MLMNGYPQIQGIRSKKDGAIWANLSRTFNKILDLFPCIGE